LKRLPTEWEKKSSTYASDKRMITRIYRELKNLKSTKINNPIQKLATKLNRIGPKEGVKMAKKIEKMFTIPDHKGNENQNHTKILPYLS
jgi:uncharacterized protein (UPF0210 family)